MKQLFEMRSLQKQREYFSRVRTLQLEQTVEQMQKGMRQMQQLQERQQQIPAPRPAAALLAPPLAAAASAQHRQTKNSEGKPQIIREAEHEEGTSYSESTVKSRRRAEYEEGRRGVTRRLVTRRAWASTR